MAETKKAYVLSDSKGNPRVASVDDVELRAGGSPQELTSDQVKRLKDVGVTVEEPGAEDTQKAEIMSLTGDDLDKAVKEADIQGASNMTADQKRRALLEKSSD